MTRKFKHTDVKEKYHIFKNKTQNVRTTHKSLNIIIWSQLTEYITSLTLKQQLVA